MNIKSAVSVVLLAAVFSSFAACTGGSGSGSSKTGKSSGSEQNIEYPVEVKGETIKEKPTKVLSMSPSITEMIYDLGYESALVGVSDYTAYPDSAKSKPACGTVQLPKLDEISKVQPQIIIASSNFVEDDLIKLQQMNAEVIIMPKAVSIEQLKTNYIDLARIFEGKTTGGKKGEEVYFNLSKKLTEAQRRIKSYISQNSNAAQSAIVLKRLDYNIATGDTFEGSILKELMLENPAASYTGWVFPKEKKTELNPNIIFYDSSIDEKTLQANAVYKGLVAIKSKRIMQVDLSLFDQQGGRIFDAIYQMAVFAYPKAFEQADAGASSSASVSSSASAPSSSISR
ncbi:MAG TPA: hypothetical protein DCP97_05245 [Ruminococcaceae bacterium]|nr:hypothetical protein [Oscillospiraceae bacterium]